MSDARITAGRKLAADLNAIRKESGVSVKDVMDATRLAENVVEEMEITGLVSNPMFNRVYLRSIFRSYARAIGLEESSVLNALEEALGGTYDGSLRPGADLETVNVDENDRMSSDKATDEDTSARNESGTDEAPGSGSEVDETEDGETVADPEANKATQQGPELSATSVSSAPSPPVPSALPGPAQPAGRVVLLPNMRGMWVAAVAAIVLIALIAVAALWVVSRSDTAQEDIQGSPGATEAVEQPALIELPKPTLPDTLSIAVTASVEPLDPIRITLDMEQQMLISSVTDTVQLPIEPFVRFPLWIEMDSTVVFRFLQVAEFEREVEHATFTVEGHKLPPEWVDEAGVYTVNRDSVLSWLRRQSDVP